MSYDFINIILKIHGSKIYSKSSLNRYTYISPFYKKSLRKIVMRMSLKIIKRGLLKQTMVNEFRG